MIDVDAHIDKEKGQLSPTDILAIASDIDLAVRQYNKDEVIYPPNRPDFGIKLIRTYEKKY